MRAGVSRVKSFSEVADGRNLNRPEFLKAIDFANRKDCPILVRSVSRILRPREYHSKKNPGATLNQSKLKEIAGFTQLVPLLVAIPPGTNWRDVISREAKIGQELKGRKGGRPKSTRGEYMTWSDDYLDMYQMRDDGHSLSEISTEFGCPRSTVQSIVNRPRKS